MTDRATHLRSVGKVCGLLVVQVDRLGVEADGGGPVVFGEGLVALVLQRRCLLLWGGHVCGVAPRGVLGCQARRKVRRIEGC